MATTSDIKSDDAAFVDSVMSSQSVVAVENLIVSNSLDPDLDQYLSVLTWVQTVCKGYQQMAKVAARKQRVKIFNFHGE